MAVSWDLRNAAVHASSCCASSALQETVIIRVSCTPVRVILNFGASGMDGSGGILWWTGGHAIDSRMNQRFHAVI